MSVINWPILYINDPLKGRPLFNGQIFVGEPDLDPEDGNGNPINSKQLRVVLESGAKVNVNQPFVMSAGGNPVYNGKPVSLDVEGDYSIKVLDKNGVQTYYVSNVKEPYTPSTPDVKSFGAVGDGVTDDTQAFISAIASISGKGALLVPTGIYKITSTLFISGKVVNIRGEGSSITELVFYDVDGFVISTTSLPDKESIEITGLTIRSTVDGTRIGISRTGDTGSQLGTQCIIRECQFKGVSNITCWNVPILLTNSTFTIIKDNFFRGNTTSISTMSSCVRVVDSTDVKILSNFMYWVDTGVLVEVSSEGILVKDTHIVPCNIGVKHIETGNYNDISNNHISAHVIGVLLGTTGVNSVNHNQVNHNLIFKNSNSVSAFVGIRVRGKKCSVMGNEILIPAASAPGGETGIDMAEGSDYCRIVGNQVSDMDTAILIHSTLTKCTIVANTFANNSTDITDNSGVAQIGLNA